MSPRTLRLAEVVNGRAAMLGILSLAFYEVIISKGILQNLDHLDLSSIWWAVGIYAS